MPQYLNPKRLPKKHAIKFVFLLVHFIRIPLLLLGFRNDEYYYVHGEQSGNKLTIGKNVSTANATFNISSGNITIGENTIFGHNVSVITGVHRFYQGKLAKLSDPLGNNLREVPTSGNDIRVGSGCFIGAGAIILSNVVLGDNVIVAAGAVVTKSFSSGSFLAGVPAKLIHQT